MSSREGPETGLERCWKPQRGSTLYVFFFQATTFNASLLEDRGGVGCTPIGLSATASLVSRLTFSPLFDSMVSQISTPPSPLLHSRTLNDKLTNNQTHTRFFFLFEREKEKKRKNTAYIRTYG